MTEPTLEDIYRDEYEGKGAQRGIGQYAAKQDMAAVLDALLKPRSVLDVGCGRGWWMEYWLFHRPEVRTWGVDGAVELIKRTESCHPITDQYMRECDLREGAWWARSSIGWNLVLCVEVGEHLEPEHAPGLVKGLCSLCASGGTIFFSAAAPGQKGVHHVNCQPKEYWVELFEAQGFEPREDLLLDWHERLRPRGAVCRNIRRNAVFFTPRRER